MKGKQAFIVGSFAILAAAAPAFAHHSFAAEFDVNKPIVLKGRITKVELTNPHGWLYINVKGEDGKVTNWAIETGAPASLIKRGGNKQNLAVGTLIVVDGWLAKDGSHTVNGKSIKLPDGRDLSAGSSNGDSPQ